MKRKNATLELALSESSFLGPFCGSAALLSWLTCYTKPK
jgi:hypothetical protein